MMQISLKAPVIQGRSLSVVCPRGWECQIPSAGKIDPANGYSSAIFHHLQHNQGHSFKLESTDVLDRETRWWERGVKEAIYERMYNPSLNREGGLRVDLSGTWDLAQSHTTWDGSKVNLLSLSPWSLDYDPMTDFIYWGHYWRDSGSIGRARRDGSNTETIVEWGADRDTRGLSLDHAGGNVYWGESDGNISVARKDGSFVRTLLTSQGDPSQLVLDPRNG
ncbi:hypothetical protein Bbelb_037730 [Branchiostoma belcheri]|nr:hypothetical protein Bbelb_037730 [Branchiostoma belcheri]